MLPTPGLAGACVVGRAPGAMISASHNPYPDNGIKFFEAGGRKLRDETEARIEAELAAILADGSPPREGMAIGECARGRTARSRTTCSDCSSRSGPRC